MKHATFFPAVFLVSAFATPALAEAPRIITLQSPVQTVLPGAHDGAKHGVTVRRGSGFPAPFVGEAPGQVANETQSPVRKTVRKKRKRGW